MLCECKSFTPQEFALTTPDGVFEVTELLVICAGDKVRGVREAIGGPEAKPFSLFAEEYLQVRGLHRRLIRLHMSEPNAKRMGFVPAYGREGATTWRDWLLTHADERKSRVRTKPLPPGPFNA